MLPYDTGICYYAFMFFHIFYCFCPFLSYTFSLNLVLIDRRNGPRYQRVLALCVLLTGVIPKGQIFRKCCVRCLCIFCLCKFESGLFLWFMDNLWFDDLRALLIGDRLNIAFCHDVILCA